MSYLFISPNNFIINEIHNKTPDIYTEYKSIMNKYEYGNKNIYVFRTNKTKEEMNTNFNKLICENIVFDKIFFIILQDDLDNNDIRKYINKMSHLMVKKQSDLIVFIYKKIDKNNENNEHNEHNEHNEQFFQYKQSLFQKIFCCCNNYILSDAKYIKMDIFNVFNFEDYNKYFNDKISTNNIILTQNDIDIL